MTGPTANAAAFQQQHLPTAWSRPRSLKPQHTLLKSPSTCHPCSVRVLTLAVAAPTITAGPVLRLARHPSCGSPHDLVHVPVVDSRT